MGIVAQGATAELKLEVRNSVGGQLIDPTNLSLTVYDNLGDDQDVFPITYPGDIVRDAVGLYHYDWVVPVDQTLASYTAYWNAILFGSPTPAYEQWIVVAQGSLQTGPLVFMQAPDDYDAVRELLGVTILDYDNDVIESPAFGVQAEMLVKAKISNWETQMGEANTLLPIRLATIYATAALMGESIVRGGTIGRVRPLSTGEGRDWEAFVAQMWNRYGWWLGIADASDEPSEQASQHVFVPILRSGPTTARRRMMSTVMEPMDFTTWWMYQPWGPLPW